MPPSTVADQASPTARRITGKSQSQHGQAALGIGCCSSPYQRISHDVISSFEEEKKG
jgi:hypothetical protein